MAEPELRFKRQDGSDYSDWEEKRLGDIASRVTRKNKNNETDIPLTIASIEGLVDQRTYFGKTIASKDMSGYYLLNKGEFAYNKSYSKGYDYGSIKRLDNYDCGALSTLYICFALNKYENSDFYNCYFNGLSWYSQMREICAEGARNHGLLNVSANDFFDIKLSVPSDSEEQRRIQEFFQEVDSLISESENEVEKIKELKNGCLQKMFPHDGEKVPEVRFPGFTDDWEQRKLGDYVDIVSGDAPSKFEEGNELYVKVDDLNYNLKYVTDSQNKVAIHKSIKKASKGSVVFPKRGAAIMTNKVRILAEDSYMDTNMMALSSDKIDSEFLYNTISKEGLYKIADTSTIPQINNKHIEPYEVMLPDLEEQKRIGGFFKDIDNLITLHQRECEKYRELKRGLLQKMFV